MSVDDLKGEREKELDGHVLEGNLVELHTHLMGMGSADFWVSRIMKTYLPRVLQNIGCSKKDDIINGLVSDLTKRPFLPLANDGNSMEDKWRTYLEKAWGETIGAKDTVEDFSFDVVFSVKNLCSGFGIFLENVKDTETREELRKSELETLLTTKAGLDNGWLFIQKCKKYTVFNMVDMKFVEVEGIQNSDLVSLMRYSSEVRASVRNCFEMLSTVGHVPSEEDKRVQFRGNFTPAFYPQRYHMKDCIYEQRVEVLAILLNQVLSRYGRGGVKYVEFSMSARDLVKDHVLQTLIFDSFKLEYKDTDGERKRDKLNATSTGSGTHYQSATTAFKGTMLALQNVLDGCVDGEQKDKLKEILTKFNDFEEKWDTESVYTVVELLRKARSLVKKLEPASDWEKKLGAKDALAPFAGSGCKIRNDELSKFALRATRSLINITMTKYAVLPGSHAARRLDKRLLQGFLSGCLEVDEWTPSWLQDYGHYNEFPGDMQFRFLAAFPRTKFSEKNSPNPLQALVSCCKVNTFNPTSHFDAICTLVANKFQGLGTQQPTFLGDGITSNDVKTLARKANHFCQDQYLATIYPQHIETLSKLQRSLGLNDDTNITFAMMLCRNYVVGLDWVGDEMFVPYCFFCHSEVEKFVKKCHEEFNNRFGLRIHAGEGVHRPALNCGFDKQVTKVYLLCMYTLVCGITKVVRYFKAKKYSNRPPVRIGHGIAFCVGSDTLHCDTRNALETTLNKFISLCEQENIPFEINPTSNDMLVLDTHGTNRSNDTSIGALCTLHIKKVRPIICTDNDGIWAIHKCSKHYHHVSIAGEICRVIQLCSDVGAPLLQNARILDSLVKVLEFSFLPNYE